MVKEIGVGLIKEINMGKFKKLKKKNHELKSFKKISKVDIIHIEKLFNISLPSDYVTFLLKYNGVVSNDAFNEIYLKDINKNVNVDVIYGIDTGNDASNIEYWTNAYIDDLFESTIIIGDSIQHGFFVLVCDGSNDGVYYYDDSYSLSSSDDENNVYFIANTFDEFFTLLYN